MANISYSDKLKDSRWQKRRLQILDRDKWACSVCSATHKTLHVHHLDYEPNTEPWEYPDHYLQTLCEDCHTEYEESKSKVERNLLGQYRLQFKDDFIRACLYFVMSYDEISDIVYLISELGGEKSLSVLREAYQNSPGCIEANAILNSPKKCPACGNIEFKSYEKYQSSKCTVCGYVHQYGQNTISQTGALER